MAAVGAAKVAADVELGRFEGSRREVGTLEAGAEAVVDRDEGGRAVRTGDGLVAGLGHVDLGASEGELGCVGFVGGLGLEALGCRPAADEGLAVGGAVERGVGETVGCAVG